MQKPKVPTPCLNICSIDPDTGYCRGCYRDIREVQGWGRFSDDERYAIWVELIQRRLDDGDMRRHPLEEEAMGYRKD